MSGPGAKPQEQGATGDGFVEVAPAREPLRVSFDEPERSPEQQVRPLRMAMTWIFLLVGLGALWSSCLDDDRPSRAPGTQGTPGTTTL